jgi:hypothetical protein
LDWRYKIAGGFSLVVAIMALWIVASSLAAAVGYKTRLNTGDMTKLPWLREKKDQGGDKAV